MKNIKIIYFDTLEYIREDWSKVFNNSKLTYFCSLEWHQVVLSFYHATFLTKKLNRLKYFMATDENNKNNQVLGFFYLTKTKKGKIINFSHLLGPSDYYDFIYNDDLDPIFIKEVVLQIVKDENISNVGFSHIKKNSKLYEALSLMDSFHFQSLKCVSIALDGCYEAHIKKLSKNVRQNLRTANNRIRKNNIAKEITFLTAKDIESIDFEQLKAIYKKRSSAKVQNTYWKTKLYKLLDDPLWKEIDMFDIDAIKSTDFIIGIIKLDNNIAAYFFGLKNKLGIEINRVAINDDFKRYSPGMVLLDEFIKKSFELGIQNIDLTVGDEKYKYDLGGETHEIVNSKGKICID